MREIREELFTLRDESYRDFQKNLIPTVSADTVIGVRTPALRAYAKQLTKREDAGELVTKFLSDLPHIYFDENQLHAFIISEMKDYEKCMEEICRFLPYVDNWATCDQLTPKVFKKHREQLLPHIESWIASGETYKIRFGIKMLMDHYLEEDFDLRYPEMVAAVRSEEYYVNMMIAWYYATALAKQYDAVLPFIENKCLAVWTHNKAIQKSVESFRISDEQKTYLRTLRIKTKG